MKLERIEWLINELEGMVKRVHSDEEKIVIYNSLNRLNGWAAGIKKGIYPS